MNEQGSKSLPTWPKPYWPESIRLSSFPKLEEDIEVDIAIVGGGITGVTAAYLLSIEGVKVALLEADKLLNGATGHTTAKVTAQHHLFYDELIQHVGVENAKRYFESNQQAIQLIQSTSEKLAIDCEFQPEDAYVYAVTDAYAKQVEREYKAYQQLGIDGDLTGAIPFDLPVRAALRMRHQAQFHPLKFLAGLVAVMEQKGVQIFERTVAVDVEQTHRPAVVTRNGHKVIAKKILSCSHYPFYDGRGFYFARMYAERAYILAATTGTHYPGGMYISAESPARSLRSVRIHDQPMVLISGDGHRTGEGGDTAKHYQDLQTFGEQVLGLQQISYRWSNQDLYTLDKIPYIGEITNVHPNVLVATGYKKWGMTSGVVAAELMRDIVMGRDNPYQDLYHPARFYADPSLRRFLLHNGNVAAHLIKGKIELPGLEPAQLVTGEGAVVTYNGRRAGAYKEADGKVYIVDTTCTHMGCEVNWNHGERTWDCPCHGSRFAHTGEVVEGPAKQPLRRLD
ncbi:FAD-dependent oxidoreductase [Alicyclobacillus fastidiosus]|uniref:FAD-dependent oxidoreductase n=1 Tax=Alicyclobacillus fastidiosus TaxID=392011 RepID=A0ABV5ADS6_9BACL|nr:FAD-dependent oxidoreductase [Alicyclobacillus fastidiosus]WEH08768.1 FAD-dependent oxidoreductase [Alicyclobacillus fastidiosus]